MDDRNRHTITPKTSVAEERRDRGVLISDQPDNLAKASAGREKKLHGLIAREVGFRLNRTLANKITNCRPADHNTALQSWAVVRPNESAGMSRRRLSEAMENRGSRRQTEPGSF
ncbi:hypothetical protein VTH06DRAFT_4602 [Thermothelomyces fergusii]